MNLYFFSEVSNVRYRLSATEKNWRPVAQYRAVVGNPFSALKETFQTTSESSAGDGVAGTPAGEDVVPDADFASPNKIASSDVPNRGSMSHAAFAQQ